MFAQLFREVNMHVTYKILFFLLIVKPQLGLFVTLGHFLWEIFRVYFYEKMAE